MKKHSGGKTRYLILGLLSEGEMSGYDIRRITHTRFGFFWSESFGQIYPELRRMEKDALVRIVTGNGARNAGKRKTNRYAITRKGLEVVRAWTATSADRESARFESVLKVYFCGLAEGSALDLHLSEFAKRHEESLNTLEAMEAELKRIEDPHGNHSFALMTIDLGKRTYKAWIDWAKSYSKPDSKQNASNGKGA